MGAPGAPDAAAGIVTSPHGLVERLEGRLREVLAPLTEGGRRWALLDYPRYANAGDSAIWVGTLRCFRVLGAPPPVRTSDLRAFDPDRLAPRLGDGTIFLSGGGNFGDLYPVHQRFREAVVQAFPHNRIVQLPQTIHFSSNEHVARTRRVLARHGDFVLMVRDHRSKEFAEAQLGIQATLCPDMAFGLGSLTPSGPPSRDALWLLRADQEAASSSASAPPAARDWCGDDFLLARAQHAVGRRLARARTGAGRAVLHWALERTYRRVALRRLDRAVELLSTARRVATDRLHGHILCLLLGVPHVVLGDRHGKVLRFREAWTATSGLAIPARSLDEARTLMASSGVGAGEDRGGEACA